MKNAQREPVETEFRRGGMGDGDEAEFLGLFGSIRRVLVTTLAAVESRLELFSAEAKDLKVRAFSLAALGVALVFFVFMTIVCLVAGVMFLLWKTGLLVLIGFSLFFVAVAVVSFIAARKNLEKVPFGDSVDQLRKDRDLISEEFY